VSEEHRIAAAIKGRDADGQNRPLRQPFFRDGACEVPRASFD